MLKEKWSKYFLKPLYILVFVFLFFCFSADFSFDNQNFLPTVFSPTHLPCLALQVQSLPIGDQKAEDLVTCARLSELLLQPPTRAKRRGRQQKLSFDFASWGLDLRSPSFLHLPCCSLDASHTSLEAPLNPLVRPVTTCTVTHWQDCNRWEC